MNKKKYSGRFRLQYINRDCRIDKTVRYTRISVMLLITINRRWVQCCTCKQMYNVTLRTYTYKSYFKSLKDYLKGTSGRESELPEDNVSADGIASAAGSVSDSPDSSSIFCFSCPLADVEGAVDGADSVF